MTSRDLANRGSSAVMNQELWRQVGAIREREYTGPVMIGGVQKYAIRGCLVTKECFSAVALRSEIVVWGSDGIGDSPEMEPGMRDQLRAEFGIPDDDSVTCCPVNRSIE